MKLLNLTLKDFLCHADLVLDLGAPLTVIQGQNGAGKTSIRDAIQYALIGRCRSTDAAGRGAANLIRAGRSEAVVSLTVGLGSQSEPNYTITRQINSKGVVLSVLRSDTGEVLTGQAAQAKLEDLRHNLPAGLIEAVLDSPALLAMGAKQRSECLTEVLDVRLTEPQLRELAEDEGLSPDAIGSIMLGVNRFRPPDRVAAPDLRFITAGVLAEVYDAGYQKRAAVNAELRTLRARLASVAKPRPAAYTPETQQRAEDGLDELELRLKGLEANVMEASVQAGTHARLTAMLARVKEAPGAAVQIPMEPDQENEREASAQLLADLREKMVKARAFLQASQGDLAAAKAEIKRIKSRSAICPSVCAPRVCAYLQEEMNEEETAARLAEAESAWDEINETRKTAENAVADLMPQIEAQERVIETLAARETKRQAVEGAAALTSTEIEAQLAPLADAPRLLADLKMQQQHAQEEIKKIREGVAKGNAAMEEIERYNLTAQAAQECEADAAVLDEAVKALAPGKLPAAAARKGAAPLLDRVNATLATLMPERGYRIDIEVGKTGLDIVPQVRFGRSVSVVNLPAENLSTSERMRLGAAIGIALSSITGLGLVIVDDMEILVGEARGAMSDVLIGAVESGHIASAVAISSAESATLKSDELIRGVWIENGAVA